MEVYVVEENMEELVTRGQKSIGGLFVVRGVFETPELAVEYLLENYDMQDVVVRRYIVRTSATSLPDIDSGEGEILWGPRVNWSGENDYGWIDLRDAPTDDPELQEYLRLKNKFENANESAIGRTQPVRTNAAPVRQARPPKNVFIRGD